MKTLPRIGAGFAPLSQSMQSLWIASMLLSLFLALSAGAAVIPLSVPASGVGPLNFDSLPTTNDGWSMAARAGANSSITTVAGMDAAANTNYSANITNPLPSDSQGSTPTIPFNILAGFRWNAVDHNLESRPVGVAYNVLLLTLNNASGQDRDSFVLAYDFGALFPSSNYENEDNNNLLAGFRVYYSLSGRPESWIHIPDFDGGLAIAGQRLASVNLSPAWESGANLFIMWTDDNAVSGSQNMSSGPIEGPYTIDNLSVTFGGPTLAASVDRPTGSLNLTWPTGTGSQLYEATIPNASGLGAPTGWSLVPGQSDGAATVSLPVVGGVQKFYTLRR